MSSSLSSSVSVPSSSAPLVRVPTQLTIDSETEASPSSSSSSSSPSPSWLPNSSSSHCLSCHSLFSFLVRRHHCRRCGLLFCSSCSSKRVPIGLLPPASSTSSGFSSPPSFFSRHLSIDATTHRLPVEKLSHSTSNVTSSATTIVASGTSSGAVRVCDRCFGKIVVAQKSFARVAALQKAFYGAHDSGTVATSGSGGGSGGRSGNNANGCLGIGRLHSLSQDSGLQRRDTPLQSSGNSVKESTSRAPAINNYESSASRARVIQQQKSAVIQGALKYWQQWIRQEGETMRLQVDAHVWLGSISALEQMNDADFSRLVKSSTLHRTSFARQVPPSRGVSHSSTHNSLPPPSRIGTSQPFGTPAPAHKSILVPETATSASSLSLFSNDDDGKLDPVSDSLLTMVPNSISLNYLNRASIDSLTSLDNVENAAPPNECRLTISNLQAHRSKEMVLMENVTKPRSHSVDDSEPSPYTVSLSLATRTHPIKRSVGIFRPPASSLSQSNRIRNTDASHHKHVKSNNTLHRASLLRVGQLLITNYQIVFLPHHLCLATARHDENETTAETSTGENVLSRLQLHRDSSCAVLPMLSISKLVHITLDVKDSAAISLRTRDFRHTHLLFVGLARLGRFSAYHNALKFIEYYARPSPKDSFIRIFAFKHFKAEITMKHKNEKDQRTSALIEALTSPQAQQCSHISSTSESMKTSDTLNSMMDGEETGLLEDLIDFNNDSSMFPDSSSREIVDSDCENEPSVLEQTDEPVTSIINNEHSSFTSEDAVATTLTLQQPVDAGSYVEFQQPLNFSPTAQVVVAAGHGLYDATSELTRLGIPNSYWRISRINQGYRLCSSYPSVLCVPKRITDDELFQLRSFRELTRIPVLVWRRRLHAADDTICDDVGEGPVLLRSSQPLTGLMNQRNEMDERLLRAAAAANPKSSTLVIADARPLKNARANQAVGGGVEVPEFYVGGVIRRVHIEFLGCENIHVVRRSYKALHNLLVRQREERLSADPMSVDIVSQQFHTNLAGTFHLHHLCALLVAANYVVNMLHQHQHTVLLRCSSGWDRTAQISALSQLMLDPHFRSLKGFMQLIEKEFLSFGHKMLDRVGLGLFRVSGEESCIFHQFLDCVSQLRSQREAEFEFNEALLIFIDDEANNHLTGTFLLNSEFDRLRARIHQRTLSAWDSVMENPSLFVNHNFLPTHETIVCDVHDLKFRSRYYFRN